ncbi:MAG: hypothetical protein JNM07_09340 [Phycisphaerae bacterium]|nr:hypothetical protein [Phycisphaerae bacterium]
MLALAAAAGVMAVFISTEVMVRVGGTALVTAVACGLAMPVSRRLDETATRAGALVGLVSIVTAYVVASAAIWIETMLGWRTSSRLALTALVVVVCGQIAGVLVSLVRPGAGRTAARAGLCADSAAAALFVGGVWWDAGLFLGDSVSEKLVVTGWWVAGTGVPAALALIGAGARDRPWRWLGAAASAGALAMAVAGVWFIDSDDPTWFILALSVALVIGYANVAVRVPLGDAGVWARLIAVGATATTGGCLTALSYTTSGFHGPGSDTLTRITGAAGIVSACSTISLVVLYRLNRRAPGVSRNVAEIASVRVTCPHCGRARAAAVGESACPGCGLFVTIGVREPRCAACDYSMLGIPGGRCPECGTAVAAAT